MKASDLMIGDWVVYNGDVEYIDPIRIEGMDIATDMLITSDREDVGFNGVEPIPLTTEILEKNGFVKDEKDDNMYYWNWSVIDDCMSYDKETSKVRIFYVLCGLVFVKNVQYVHELQHALRLFEIKKEIEL
jgi:hypothetical protein